MKLLILAVLCAASLGTAVCESCGIVPIAPIPPIGCKSMRPVCVCDSSGKKCVWQWQCVK